MTLFNVNYCSVLAQYLKIYLNFGKFSSVNIEKTVLLHPCFIRFHATKILCLAICQYRPCLTHLKWLIGFDIKLLIRYQIVRFSHIAIEILDFSLLFHILLSHWNYFFFFASVCTLIYSFFQYCSQYSYRSSNIVVGKSCYS